MLKFMEIKSNEPKITQKEISKQLGFYDSTFKRYRDDIDMDSPYKRKNTKKRNTKWNTSISETQLQTPGENKKSNKSTRIIKKNDLKGGSPLGNQIEKTNYSTIARSNIDNIQ